MMILGLQRCWLSRAAGEMALCGPYLIVALRRLINPNLLKFTVFLLQTVLAPWGSGTLLDVCPYTQWILVRLSGVRSLKWEPKQKRGGAPDSSPLQDSWRNADKPVGHIAPTSSLHRGHLHLLLVLALLSLTLKAYSVWSTLGGIGL